MNLVVDYGNSFAKVGLFEHYNLINQQAFDDEERLRAFLQNFSGEHFISSSVTHNSTEVLDWVDHVKRKFILTAPLPLPISNLYATPNTLGGDRLASACGAHHRFPGSHCLVIDTGTCIKYDFLDKEGNYHGGAISPGLKMRFQAMNHFTAKLPLVGIVE